MGYNKLAGDLLTAAELNSFYSSSGLYGTSSTGNDSYAITVTPVPNAYSAGDRYTFKADVANTGVATLNVNGLGAKTIKKDGSVDLVTNDIVANQVITVVYDGTHFQILSFQSGWSMIKKAANEDKISNTTYTNDSALQFSYLANTTYLIRIRLKFTGANGAGFRAGLNTTQAVSFLFSGFFSNYSSNALSDPTSNNHVHVVVNRDSNATVVGHLDIDVTMTTGANAGTFSLQWAQEYNRPYNTTVYLGSTLEYTKL